MQKVMNCLKFFLLFILINIAVNISFANVLGGGTGSGADVTIIDNGTTVTMSNGIISATITKSNATITNYSFNGYNMLSGGYKGGSIYWSWNMPNYQNPSKCTYALNADPTGNNGEYAEIQLHMKWPGDTSTAAMDVDVYYSLTRGSQGIYASAMLTHPPSYPKNPGGEWRMSSYVGSTFDWLSVDSLRNRKMATFADWASGSAVTGAPPEVQLLTTGIYKNMYECKYDYSADLGDINVWGWSSSTKNLGIWVTAPSKEYYNGGPMKRELMCHNGPTMLNMLNGEHYGMGKDLDVDSAEIFQKLYGPFLIYCNSVPTGTPNAWSALWADAQKQALAEQSSWPYTWFKNDNYLQKNQRGTVSGRLVISDTTTPKALAANMWIGVAKTPNSTTNITDFQMWAKNYQFWVRTDSLGNFSIPNVHPGLYNIYAFGPSAAGQMTKLNYVNVAADSTSALGDVVWKPTRTAPTIWEIGIPDRSAGEYKHGKDWWTSDTFPSTHWGKFMDYPDEFPNGVNFTIGQSNIATDWNFVMNYDKTAQTAAPEWKINFNLTSAPKSGTNTAALYLAFAASNSSAVIVKVNGSYINTTAGTVPPNQVNAKVRKGIHGSFGDLRLLFNGKLLKAGANQVVITMRNTGSIGDIMFDYVRLEASGTSLSAPLPIESLPLTLTKENATSVLHWSTLAEQNNNHFEVQRSADGISFISIQSIASKGNSIEKEDYSFTDNSPLKGVSYYRIKQVDKGGKYSYGNVVSVNFTAKDNALKLYPNPVRNYLTLSFYAKEQGELVANIVNANGVVVKEFSIKAVTGSNNQQINITSLPSGNYSFILRNNVQSISSRFEKL